MLEILLELFEEPELPVELGFNAETGGWLRSACSSLGYLSRNKRRSKAVIGVGGADFFEVGFAGALDDELELLLEANEAEDDELELEG